MGKLGNSQFSPPFRFEVEAVDKASAFAPPLLWFIIGCCGLFAGPAAIVGERLPSAGHAIFLATWGSAFCGLAFALCLAKPRPIDCLVVGWVALLGCSSLWSALQIQSIEAASAAAFTALGAYCISAKNLEGIFRTISTILTLAFLASFVLYIFGFGITMAGEEARLNVFGLPAMNGIFEHKNFAGFMSVVGALTTLATFQIKWLKYPKLSIFFAGSFLTGSSTSILLVVFGCGLFSTLRFVRSNVDVRLSIFVIVSSIAVTLGVFFDDLLFLVGRDSGFTGRDTLWATGLQMFWLKPLLGWGYFGLISREGGPFFEYYHSPYYIPAHLQSDYIQSLAENGLIGFILFGLIIFFALNRAVRDLIEDPESLVATGQLVLLILVLIESAVERVNVGGGFGLFFILLVSFRKAR